MEKVLTLVGGSVSQRIERETYLIGSYHEDQLQGIKIGMCNRGTSEDRLRKLQTGSLNTLKLLTVLPGNQERDLHRRFATARIRQNSEYFVPTPELLELLQNNS